MNDPTASEVVGKVIVTVYPQKGRSTRWIVRCSCAQKMPPQINKQQAQLTAALHVDARHNTDAIIRTRR